MSTTAPKSATTPIPVQLAEPEFETFILPHLAMPKRGPKCTLGYHRVFNFIYGSCTRACNGSACQYRKMPRVSRHPLYDRLQSLCEMGRRWVALAGIHCECAASCGREASRPPRAAWRWDQHRGQKRGDGIGYSGYKHQKGEKVIAIIDNNGSVLAPVPVALVNETDMVLLPEGLRALKQVAKEVGLDLRGSLLNHDGGFDAAHNRKRIFNAGLTRH